jgi:hypothetical protein
VLSESEVPMLDEKMDGTDWPTTMRFSRRLGESVRDSRYAVAIEGPPRGRALIDYLPKTLLAWLSRQSARNNGAELGRS